MTQSTTFNQIKNNLTKLYRKCMTCPKELKDKEIKQLKQRCKKCLRQYEKVWYPGHKEFLEVFKDSE